MSICHFVEKSIFTMPTTFRSRLWRCYRSLISRLRQSIAPVELSLRPLVIETNGRLTFNGDRASIDFLNLATKDVDLSFRGEIDLHDANDLSIKTVAVLPIFDLATQTIDCASRIEFTPVGLTLAPPIEELEFRGSLSKGDWSVNAKEGGATRVVRLCFGDSRSEEHTSELQSPCNLV